MPASGTVESQLAIFDRAMKLFHQRAFREALPLFAQASTGEDNAIAHTAQLHGLMCKQRLEREGPEFSTAEDNYAYGLALANRRELAGAEQYLKKALALSPKADYALYTLAMVKGLQGDIAAAAGHLARAIELQPSNRNSARTDPDFHDLLRHPQIRELVSHSIRE
jgi:tetratricopeptide (TPR) repeat protein